MKKWIIGKPDENAARKISAEFGISQMSAEVLVSRGLCTSAQAEAFFGAGQDSSERGLYSPFTLPDMKKAADTVNAALDSGEKIVIYGDYDCDGILSAAALYNYLLQVGGNVSYFINKRSDGYGMNIDNVRRLAEEGAQLIITVDNGISAVREAELCAELGVKLVITDHHTPPPVLPKAAAVVDPHIDSSDNKAPFRDLCGCGVVMKLITAMEGGDEEITLEMMSDFAAIATIGDIMPLTGENRVIVRHGLHYLENTENLGLKALINAASGGKGIPYDSKTVAFTVVPRINAAGRMGSAMDAAELFTTDDPERAEELAKMLCGLNDKRKKAEEAILASAEDFFNICPDRFNSPVITAHGKDWHAGVIGIAAAKLCERTGKPVFMISENEDGTGVGSARAPEGFSVYKALSDSSDLLLKFGGHKGAGGFSISADKIDEFHERLCKIAGDAYFVPEIITVKALSPNEVTTENVERLSSELAPFGEDNPEPVYLLAGCVINNVRPLAEGKYTRVSVSFGGTEIAFPMFKTKYGDLPFGEGDTVNITASLRINEYNGKKSVTLDVCDMRVSGANQQKLLNGEKAYHMMKRGIFPEDKNVVRAMLPPREEYAAVYRLIPEDRDVSEDYIFNKLYGKINSCAINVILDAFTETGLIQRSFSAGTVRRLKTEKGKKADFNTTNIIRSINEKLQ